MKGFLNILYLLVGGCSLAFLFLLLNDNSTNTFVSGTCGVVSTIGCGTTGGFSNYGNVKNGKVLFRDNCAMCHAKNMRSEMTGPALIGSLNKWSRDSIQLQAYFRNSNAYLDTVSSERLMVLRHKYIKTTSHKFKFSLRGSEM